MGCFRPIEGYRDDRDGKVRFGRGSYTMAGPLAGIVQQTCVVPCGKCLGCRAEYRRQWSIRMMHELRTHPEGGIFLTLTYNPEHLPPGGTLVKKHVQDFIRSLRKKLARKGYAIRYVAVGEYGSPRHTERPHYHLILYGYDFPDRQKHGDLWTSRLIEDTWGRGYAPFGDVNWHTCEYVAGYIFKKLYASDGCLSPYGNKEPVFSLHSRSPGIGKPWFDRYWMDAYPSDQIVSKKGKLVRPPKRYDEWLKKERPEVWAEVEQRRIDARDEGESFEEIVDRCKKREQMQQRFLDQAYRHRNV